MKDDRFLPEELLLNSMPALQTVFLDGWAVRLNAGYTYRANCVCPLHWNAGEDVSEKIAQCEELFRRQGMSAVFKVTPSLQAGFAEELERKGYEKRKTVFVMTADLPEKMPEPDAPVVCLGAPDEEWLASSAELLGVPKGQTESLYRENMRNIAPAAVFISGNADGKAIGCGYGTVERGYVGVYGLHVSPEYRRRGVGTALLGAACGFGRQSGAEKAYLIVHSQNRNAIALYERLGFRKSYEYFFYAQPGENGVTDG